MHQRITQSRRDDLESLCYVLIYIQKGNHTKIKNLIILGMLPWKMMNESPEFVKFVKLGTEMKQLCEGLHQDFYHLLNYVRKLEYDEEPDYGYCLALMERVLLMNQSR
jgi:hypothetical protein